MLEVGKSQKPPFMFEQMCFSGPQCISGKSTQTNQQIGQEKRQKHRTKHNVKNQKKGTKQHFKQKTPQTETNTKKPIISRKPFPSPKNNIKIATQNKQTNNQPINQPTRQKQKHTHTEKMKETNVRAPKEVFLRRTTTLVTRLEVSS